MFYDQGSYHSNMALQTLLKLHMQQCQYMTECVYKDVCMEEEAILWVTCALKAMQHHLLPKTLLLNESVFDFSGRHCQAGMQPIECCIQNNLEKLCLPGPAPGCGPGQAKYGHRLQNSLFAGTCGLAPQTIHHPGHRPFVSDCRQTTQIVGESWIQRSKHVSLTSVRLATRWPQARSSEAQCQSVPGCTVVWNRCAFEQDVRTHGM